MDLTIEPIETADMSFTVSAASQSGGSGIKSCNLFIFCSLYVLI